MKKVLCTSLLLVAVMPAVLYAQIQDSMKISDAAQEAVNGISSVAEMIITDSFTPMTGFQRGDLTFIGTPSLFRIEQAHEDPLVEGEQLGGWSLGAGAGYALRNRWLVYGILSGMHIDGKLLFQPYESLPDTIVETETGFSFLSLNAGIGWELFEMSWLSVPLFFGPHLQYYSVELKPDETTMEILMTSYSLTSSITGSGVLFGCSGGIAAYVKVLNRFAFTPYVLGMYNLNGADYRAEVSAEATGPFSLSEHYTDTFTTDPFFAVMFGLDVGYRSRSGWTYSFALGDLLAYLLERGNTVVNNGVRMRPLVFIATYKK